MHPKKSIQPKIWAPKASQIHFSSADDNTYYLSVCCIVASVSCVDVATTTSRVMIHANHKTTKHDLIIFSDHLTLRIQSPQKHWLNTNPQNTSATHICLLFLQSLKTLSWKNPLASGGKPDLNLFLARICFILAKIASSASTLQGAALASEAKSWSDAGFCRIRNPISTSSSSSPCTNWWFQPIWKTLLKFEVFPK